MRDPICQVAYFVNDAEAAAKKMFDLVGAGPFLLARNIELSSAELHGKPGDFVHTSAYGQWGDVMLELVQQDSVGPSPFRDMYEPGQEGLHHVATMVESLPETYTFYESRGYSVAAKAVTLSGTEFAFIDARGDLGHMIEVYEGSKELRGFYDFIRAASTTRSDSEVFISV